MARRKQPQPALDPAFVYSIDPGDPQRQYGVLVRLAYDPNTKEWSPDNRDWFFVFRSDGGDLHRIYPLDQLKDLRQEYRKGPAEQEAFNEWMRIHYVR